MIKRLVHEYIFKLVVGVAVTSTVAIFALIGKIWAWPNAVVGSVLLLSGILYLMDRFGIGSSLRSRVRDWLDSAAFDVKTVQDSNEFHFVVTDNVGIKTHVLQLKPGHPVAIISPQHTATGNQLAAYNRMSERERSAFWKNVRLELLRYGLEFSDLKLDGDGVAFSDTLIAHRTVSSTDFLKRLLFVRSGARLYWELLSNLESDPQALGTGVAPKSAVIHT